MKSFARRLVLTPKQKATRKWSIPCLKYITYQLNIKYNKELHNPHRWHYWAEESSNPTSKKKNIDINISATETVLRKHPESCPRQFCLLSPSVASYSPLRCGQEEPDH